MNRFLSGVGKALIFKGDQLIGVAQTLTDSTFDFSITAEEVRGGEGNALWGKYFHDSSLNVTLTDAMFNLEYVAAALGVNVNQSNGMTVKEEQVTAASGGVITVTEDPIAFEGSNIMWYKKPADELWQVATFTGKTATISGAIGGDIFCVKYFWYNPNARYITIPVNYVPAELHVTILNDLFAGDIASTKQTEQKAAGKLITDIPRLQMDGSQNLALTASGAATVSLSGSALAISTASNSCVDDPYYGTMTEEIYGRDWTAEVRSLSIADSDIELSAGDNKTLEVYTVFGTSAQRQSNDNFIYTVTPTGGSVITVSEAGVISAVGSGNATIEVQLVKDGDVVTTAAPAYAQVTVTE